MNPLVSSWMLHAPAVEPADEPIAPRDAVEVAIATRGSHLMKWLQSCATHPIQNSIHIRTFDGQRFYVAKTPDKELEYVVALAQDVQAGLGNPNWQFFDAASSCKLHIDFDSDIDPLLLQMPQIRSLVSSVLCPLVRPEAFSFFVVAKVDGGISRLIFSKIAVSPDTRKQVAQLLAREKLSVHVRAGKNTLKMHFYNAIQFTKCSGCGGHIERQLACQACHNRGICVTFPAQIQQILIQSGADPLISYQDAHAISASEDDLRLCIGSTLLHGPHDVPLHVFSQLPGDSESKDDFKAFWMSEGPVENEDLKDAVASLLAKLKRFAGIKLRNVYRKTAKTYITTDSRVKCLQADHSKPHPACFMLVRDRKSTLVLSFTCKVCGIKREPLPLTLLMKEHLNSLLDRPAV